MILKMFEDAEAYFGMVKNDIEENLNPTEDEKLILENVVKAWDELLKEKEEIKDIISGIDSLSKRDKLSIIPINSWNMKEDGYYICFDSFVLKIHDRDFRLFDHLKKRKPNIETKDGIAKFIRRI